MQRKIRTIARYLSPVRPWFPLVNATSLRRDAFAGITNAALVLPQGVAFALIGGLPPQYGLFSAIIVALVAAWWGSSRVMVSGPTTASSALLFITLASLAAPGSQAYIQLAITLTFISGVMQLAAGLAGLGGLITFVSNSVLVGFTAAAALLIAVSQLPGILGIVVEPGGAVPERIARLAPAILGTQPLSVVIAGITFATLLVSLRISRKLPAYLLALVVGSGAAWFLDAPARGIEMFAPLGSVIPSLTTPSFDPGVWRQLVPGAFAVAFVGLLSSISIGKSLAFRTGVPYDSNQEIVGQGLSNIAGSFTQCYASSGSFTRSGVNLECGAETPMSAIFASLMLFLGLVALAPFIEYVPVPAMAAIIIYVAWRLIDWAEIARILRSEPSEVLILSATFLTGLVSDLDFTILIGVMVSLAAFLNSSAHPLVLLGALVRDGQKRVVRNAELEDLPECPQIRIMKINGPIFFASVEHLEREFGRIEARAQQSQTIILIFKAVGKIDLAGADFLIDQVRKSRARGRDMHVIVAAKPILEAMRRFHVTETIGAPNLHSHKTDAMAAAVRHADDSICATCELRLFRECAGKAGAERARPASSNEEVSQ
ncbi:SulP family inorganic anion transporter [Azospirillum palustre]